MVDFQSRDTRRDTSSDDEDEEAESEAEETADSEGEAEREAEDEEGTEVETEGETETQAAAERETEDERGADTGVETADPDERGAETADVEAGAVHGDHSEAAAHESGDGQEHDEDPGHAHGQDHEDGHSHDHGHEHGAGHHHADAEELGVAVVTVSTSRSLDDDPSGDAIAALVEGDGHEVVARDLVADDLDGIQRAMLALTGRDDVDVVLTTGGTGVTPDDVTVEAVEPLFDKDLPGFGELFRLLSYEEVGTRALGSRATAGVSEGVPVFCLPGSENAVRTAVEELVLAEAPHLVGLARGE